MRGKKILGDFAVPRPRFHRRYILNQTHLYYFAVDNDTFKDRIQLFSQITIAAYTALMEILHGVAEKRYNCCSAHPATSIENYNSKNSETESDVIVVLTKSRPFNNNRWKINRLRSVTSEIVPEKYLEIRRVSQPPTANHLSVGLSTSSPFNSRNRIGVIELRTGV